MSFQTLKRFSPSLALVLLTAPGLLASAPAARSGARAAYDPLEFSVVMFGGTTAVDAATARAYDLDETWEFDGTRWIRRFPRQSPPGRSSHVMVWDSNRNEAIMFGGRAGSELLNDTWAYRGDWFSRTWEWIDTPNAPGVRQLAAAAFDPLRDRVVLFGGQRLSDDKKEFVDLFDTWEFDGTTWTRVLDAGPQLRKPLLAYDAARHQLILIGHVEDFVTKMYAWDAAAHAWNELTPENLPPCANESSVAYDSDQQLVYLIAGVCTPADPSKSSSTIEEMFAWDGTDWTKVESERLLFRSTNAVFAYDERWKSLVLFGGNLAYTFSPRSDTYMYRDEIWVNPPPNPTAPGPRSLFAMVGDPVNEVIWLYGGLNEGFPSTDFWKFEDGFWHPVEVENKPVCDFPLAAFDTHRLLMVLVCSDSGTFEWDGQEWKAFPDLSNLPEARRFSQLVYDHNLGKTILYGGYNALGEYLNKTWTWNGNVWTEVKSGKRPHFRALTSMWYDPILRRTVLYGGIGRKDRDGRLERFGDMWTFDGTNWTEIKPATLPPTRYGAQVGVDPLTGRTILFGGLRVETGENNLQKQVYANDTWEWDGSNWRQLQTVGVAASRENSAMAWDYSGRGFIVFGGWSGYYLSDTWLLLDNRWLAFAE